MVKRMKIETIYVEPDTQGLHTCVLGDEVRDNLESLDESTRDFYSANEAVKILIHNIKKYIRSPFPPEYGEPPVVADDGKYTPLQVSLSHRASSLTS